MGFMSLDQFRTFYWPTLRQLIIGLINEGMVPMLFAEGGYDQRLEVISDIPKGKAVWWFDRTDMAKAKETLGKNACLIGNVSSSMLKLGTPDKVKEYCKKLIDTALAVSQIVANIVRDVQAHMEKQDDDITVVALKRV